MKTLPNSTRMDMADFLRPYRAVVVEVGTTMADLLRPAFWVHKAGMLTVGTLLDVTTPDLTLDVQLRVVKNEKGLVHMRVMRAYASDSSSPAEAAESTAEVPDNYVVDHTTATSWRVRMRNPSLEVSTGHSTQAEAAAAAARHAKAGAGEAPADEGKAAGPVVIPDGWEDMHWAKQVKLAEEISGGDVVADGEKSRADVARDIIAAKLASGQ